MFAGQNRFRPLSLNLPVVKKAVTSLRTSALAGNGGFRLFPGIPLSFRGPSGEEWSL